MYINHFFNYSACAQLIIAPFENQLINFNREACQLVKLDGKALEGTPPSMLFQESLPEFMQFTQQLIANGQAWCDRLLLTCGEQPVRVEVQGCCSVVGQDTLLHLTLNPAEELDKRRYRSGAQRYFRDQSSLRNSDPQRYTALNHRIADNWPTDQQALQQLLQRQPPLATELSKTGSYPAVERRSIPREDTPHPTTQTPSGENKVLTTAELREREINNLIRALTQSQGRIFGPGGAAELLDMKPTTLSAKLKRYNIDRRRFSEPSGVKRA